MRATSVKVHWDQAEIAAPMSADPVAVVRAVLSVDDAGLDYGRAKLAFDQLINPSHGAADTMVRLDCMADDARQLAGPSASADARLAGLRRLLYVEGPWNDHRAFAYDQADPLGQRIGNKLLATCLATRRGNCVSMPALFLVLAEKLGLDVALATAPLHVFLRYRSESGRVLNIEATSGGHPSRDEWYRQQMPMSDRAVESGLYMRSLTKREGVALLATTVLEHLIEHRRYGEALGVSEVILEHAPRDAYTMVKQGSVCAELIRTEFTAKYRTPALVPPASRARYLMLTQRNRSTFEAAEALGWEPVA